MQTNPFAHRNLVKPPYYVERSGNSGATETFESELINKLTSTNSSFMLVGESFSGKSSMLEFICPRDKSEHSLRLMDTYYGNKDKNFLFSSLDMSGGGFDTEADFWGRLFRPLRRHLTKSLKEKYDFCMNNRFLNHKSDEWQEIFAYLSATKKNKPAYKLIVLIDEFEGLFNKNFRVPEVLGTLRGFIDSECISVVISVRKPKSLLANSISVKHTQDQQLTPSPYLNKFAELYLGSLDIASADTLLNRANFNASEINFLKKFSGCYPGIIHFGAYTLWERYKEFPDEDTNDRISFVADKIQTDVTREIFWDAWVTWPLEFKKAIAYIAIFQGYSLSDKFDVLDKSVTSENYQSLEKLGFIEKISPIPPNARIDRGREYKLYKIKSISILYELIYKVENTDIGEELQDVRDSSSNSTGKDIRAMLMEAWSFLVHVSDGASKIGQVVGTILTYYH